jgi:WD40 repeat protein/tRNA A-37 threonylcarbamoyl transferase component Bud32
VNASDSELREHGSTSVDEIVDRFESAYEDGQPPAIEDYLPADDAARAEVLIHLVHIDLERRLKAGDAARVEAYQKRYPDLSRDPGVLLDLIAAEYEQRRRREPDVDISEYLGRFPHFASQLRPMLEATLPGGPLSRSPAGERPVIPGYDVIRELGRGGMGVVYQARHIQLNRMVALKMVLNADLARPEVLTRFLFEAEVVARVQHPNVVQIHEVGAHNGRPYFALEYADGGTLEQLLAGRPWPQPQAAALVQTLARATHAAHLQGIVHRDLKPRNVLISAGGTPKITDFGLAKPLQSEGGLTVTGAVLGTPAYMSPEQASGARRAIGPASDVWSLGIILHELLTGTVPFRGPTPLDVLRQVVSDPLPLPSSRGHRLDPDLETICRKCLEKEPPRRYASAEALADDLGRYLAGEPISARPVRSAERAWRWARRNPGWAAMLATVAGLLVIIALGSPVMTLRLSQALDVSDKTRQQAEDEKRKADERSWEALLVQARASSRSRERGQRFDGLGAIRRALELPVPPGRSVAELRNVAIACLVLPDVEPAGEWEAWPSGTVGHAFDAACERYARVDKDGNISVRRVADDALLLPPLSGGIPLAWGGVSFSPDGRFVQHHYGTGGQVKVYRLGGAEAAVVLEDLDVPHNSTVAFSADSRSFAAAHRDGSVSVYDLESSPRAKELQRRQTGLHLHMHLAFRPGQPHLAVAGGNVVRVVDLGGDKRSLAELTHPYGVSSMAWHPDGQTLATACDDLLIRLWEVATGKVVSLEGHRNRGIEMAFNPAGDCLLSNDWSSLLRLWDPRTGRQLLQTPSPASAFSRDGSLLGLDQSGSRVRLLRVATRRPLRCLTASRASVQWDMVNARTSPDGRLLVVSWGDKMVFVNWASGAEVGAIPLRASSAVLFEPAGALLTSGPAGLIRWPVRAAPEAGRLEVGPPQRLAEPGNPSHHPHGCSADGSVIAILGRFNPCAIVVHRRENRRVPLGPREDVRSCAVSPDGRLVATGNHWNSQGIGATIWDAHSGQAVQDFAVGGACGVGFSPDGRWLATNGGGYRLWRVGTWEEGPRVAPPGEGGSFAFTPDSRVLALDAGFSQVRLVEVDSGTEIARLTVPEQTRVAPQCFSPDGTQLVAVGPESQSLYIWDLRALRAGLRELRLDWDWPDYPPAQPAAPGPLRVELDGGTLFPRNAP